MVGDNLSYCSGMNNEIHQTPEEVVKPIMSPEEVQRELEVKMKAQLAVASDMLGFDVTNPKEFSVEHDLKFLKWINENALYFKNVLEKNPDIWERLLKGEAGVGDIHWIRMQLEDKFDTGVEPTEEELLRAA